MKYTLLILTTLLMTSLTHSDALYKFKDKNGTWTYSDRRPDSGNYETINNIRLKDDNKPAAVEETTVPDTRSMETIRKTLGAIKSDIDQLYSDLLQTDNTTAGTLNLDFTIDQQGTVTDCTEDESSITGAKFSGKVCEKISTVNFGPVVDDNATSVNYQYNFQTTN